MILRKSDGKYSQFDEIWQTRHFWEQTGPAKKKGSKITRTYRLHQSPLISGTVALADITEQSGSTITNGDQQIIANLKSRSTNLPYNRQ